MLSGKKFKLENSTLALGTIDGHRRAVCIPDGEIVKVISGPSLSDGNQTVDVLWDGGVWTMFAIDLQARCSELEESHLNGKRVRS